MVLSAPALPTPKNGQIFDVNNFLTRENILMVLVQVLDLSSGLMWITNDIYRPSV